jgi:hypothetical protein
MSLGTFLIIAVAFCAACLIGLLAGIVLEYFAVWDEEGDPTPLPVKPQVFYEDAGGSLKAERRRIPRRQHSPTQWVNSVEDL